MNKCCRFIGEAGGWGVASNAASFVFFIVGLIAASKYGASITAVVLLAISVPLFWVGSFLAWSKKDDALAEAMIRFDSARPLFVLDVTQQPGWGAHAKDGTVIFALRNCGGRPARWIRLASQQDHKKYHTLSFAEVPSLAAGETQLLPHTVDQHGMHPGMLYEFFTNGNPPDAALVWWDIEVRFRDTDEVNKEEMVRLCFDVEAQGVYATGVPYTAKSAMQR